MSDDKVQQQAGQPGDAHAGRDAYVVGGSIIYQGPDSSSSDDAALRYLSKDKGAQRIIDWSKDDATLERPGRLLTSVRADEAIPALQMVLRRDEDLVIALLTSINEAKAKDLIGELEPSAASLARLLDAAEAITQCESAAYRSLGERTGRFSRATSARGTQGFLQMYTRGAIYWSPQYGPHATTGPIAECHQDAGGHTGTLGFPVASEVQAEHPRTKTECTWQLFEGPHDYSREVCDFLEIQSGGTIISSRKFGTHATWGWIGEASELGWRDRGYHGLPIEDMVPIGPSRRMNDPGTTGWRQRFESGTFYSSEKTGAAIRVPERWASYLKDRGDAAGSTGFPVSPALNAAQSPYGTIGQFQRFEGPWDYPKDIVDPWSACELPGGATIYHSNQHGAYTVERGNGVCYERLNGTGSWLGFPTSDEVDASTWADSPESTVQHFEGGEIFYTKKYHSIAVKREVFNFLTGPNHSSRRLGFPIRELEPLASGPDSYIQFFQHGLVTVRDNQVQVWFE
jgi:LGFP repeat